MILVVFLEFLIAYWLLARHRRRYKSIAHSLSARERLLNVRGCRIAVEEPKYDDALTKAIVQDAIAREMRAKAALRAVLIENGCTEKDVDEVMASVDGTTDGDIQMT